jgi:aminoacrylate hydrolase
MPTIKIGTDDLYYEVHGDGPPLLLVTGLNGVASFWVKQVPVLAKDFRVILHDHRGTGQSTHTRMRYSVDQMADDVLKLMDALGVESAHLAGHSTGGAIGQTLALDHPTRVRSLVLSATWAGPDPFFRRLFESRKATLEIQGLEAYARASILALAPPRWVSENDAAITEQQRVQLAAAAPAEVQASRIDAIVRFDQRARLGAVRCPTLVIVARDDMVTPQFYSDELAARIPGAKLVVLEYGGHFAPLIVPEPYNAAVGGFLRALR